jgi:hypothetical protein
MKLSLAASFGQRTDLPSSWRRVHATPGDSKIHEVTPPSSTASRSRRERAYTASVAHTLCTYQKLGYLWEMFPMSHPPQAAAR